MGLTLCVYSRQISPDEAKTLASEFLNSPSLRLSSPTRVGVSRVKGRIDKDNSMQPYYVFNADDGNGFVIVSGDDSVNPILGYSDKGYFDFDNYPPQLIALLSRFSTQLKSQVFSEKRQTSKSEKKHISDNEGKECILPTAQWGQDYPFNMYAQDVNGEKCPAGCVATAMGIIMKYNNWPETGRGYHTWISNGSQMECNFDDTTFDYSLMPDSYDAGTFNDQQAAAVAKLMQAAGAAVNMQYDLEGSGAMTCVVGHHMFEYLKYSPSCQFISAANFDDITWLNMIYDQIDSNHPVIMSGASEEFGGHAFVCDGYNDADQLHINWGWNGGSNGYFDPVLLGGFNNDIGMVINLFNDGCEKEYSRCWIDYGYLWAYAGRESGFNVSVENIETGVPFDAKIGAVTVPNNFSGDFCLALIDENDNIIEVNEEVRQWTQANSDWDKIGYSWIGLGGLTFKNVVFNTPIKQSMRLSIVAREDGDDWKLILGTIEAPSYIDVKRNTPQISHIEWKNNDHYGLTKIIYQNSNEEQVLLGDSCPFMVEINGGVCYVFIDGVYRTNGSDFASATFNFTAIKDSHKIEIFANRYEDLLTSKIVLEKAGELSSKIPEKERNLIYELTLEGPMNADDFSFITSCLYSLRHLDISATLIEESPSNRSDFLPMQAGRRLDIDDFIGASIWGLESIKLPLGLKGFEAYSLPHMNIEYLEIPASVESYEWSSVKGSGERLDFIKVNNPVPAIIDEESGPLDLSDDDYYRCNTILFVPEGSKEAYMESPSWRGYKDIRETSYDLTGKYIDYDGVRYLMLGDKAVVSDTYAASQYRNSYFVVPSNIEYEGNIYPVVGNCRNLKTGYLYLDNVTDFEFNTVYNSHIEAAIIPHLSAIYSGGKPTYPMDLMIPGATSAHYDKVGYNVNEMWSYSIDKEHNLLSIAPQYMCEISLIEINGIKAEPIIDNLYKFEDAGNLTVDITYSVFGHEHFLHTRYTPEFHSQMVAENLNLPVTQIEISSTELSIKINEEVRLEAFVYPDYALEKGIIWSSSDNDIASVSQDGIVTGLSSGSVVITAQSFDNPDIYAICNVIVYTIGDSNGNGVINIADAVNIANYVVGNDVESFVIESADVNGDSRVTFSDASATITLVLDQPVEALNGSDIKNIRAYGISAFDKVVVENYSYNHGEITPLRVSLDSNTEYVALQMDIAIPDGIILDGLRMVGSTNGIHSLATKQLDEHTYRAVLFDFNNTPLPNREGSFLELLVKVKDVNAGDIELSNIVASDVYANEYNLGFEGGYNDCITGIKELPDNLIEVNIESGVIKISNVFGKNITVSTIDGKFLTSFVAQSEEERIEVYPGIYLLTIGNKNVKVVVK
ncbi:MAG: C10 family peptidase [Muribaculaceae bacterium]|nr:C10 family peptidase [Muribaculaceae bacterium]